MKNIFHFSIIAIVVALVVTLNTNAYAGVKADLAQHDTDIKEILNDTINPNILERGQRTENGVKSILSYMSSLFLCIAWLTFYLSLIFP